MNNSNDNICLYCDYGNADFMYENGYKDFEFVFCEYTGEIKPSKHTCQFCSINQDTLKDKKMNILICRMADDIEKKGY